MRIFLSILFLLTFHYGFTQSDYTEDYFKSPVDIPIFLSASFGELRGGHFHAGIDIKTKGVVGKKIYAIADGYVSRIKISLNGYGNALYISHANGYTSVYGHLKEFNIHIDELLREYQYSKESYEIDIIPEENQIPVHKGDIIALSGNSGGSFGPHLHFEIRKTNTQEPVNPLLYGFKITDNIPPKIHRIMFYPLEKNSKINDKNTKLIVEVESKNGKYHLKNIKSIQVSGKIGLSIQANDYHNYTHNKCGIYNLNLKLDDSSYYSHLIDQFSFSNTRYINSHMDYEEYYRNNIKAHKCFIDPNNNLGIYKSLRDRGILNFTDNNKHNIKFTLIDEYQNSSTLDFEVLSVIPEIIAKDSINTDSNILVMPYNLENHFSDSVIELFFPKYSFYNTINFTYSITDSTEISPFPIYNIHSKYVPVHKKYELKIKYDSLLFKYPKKTAIALLNGDDKFKIFETQQDTNWFKTMTNEFGQYTFIIDTISPRIVSQNGNLNIIEIGDKIEFIGSDELSGISEFNGYINGEWVLFECDRKNNLYSYTVDGRIQNSNLNLEFTLIDMMGNSTTIKEQFIFNQGEI